MGDPLLELTLKSRVSCLISITWSSVPRFSSGLMFVSSQAIFFLKLSVITKHTFTEMLTTSLFGSINNLNPEIKNGYIRCGILYNRNTAPKQSFEKLGKTPVSLIRLLGLIPRLQLLPQTLRGGGRQLLELGSWLQVGNQKCSWLPPSGLAQP